jgi:hypothetical protein
MVLVPMSYVRRIVGTDPKPVLTQLREASCIASLPHRVFDLGHNLLQSVLIVYMQHRLYAIGR